jgi:transposase
MGTEKRYSIEMRERAVRMVQDQQSTLGSRWRTILSIAATIGCTAQSLHRWVVQAERYQEALTAVSRVDQERLRILEQENRRLKRANAILRKASASSVQADHYRRGKGQ